MAINPYYAFSGMFSAKFSFRFYFFGAAIFAALYISV